MKLLPDFLTLQDVLEIHKEQINAYGGSDGIRSMHLLESAIAMPMATYSDEFLHPSHLDMASAYAFHIAQNQPFLDGNKRTALACALVFLELNNISIDDPNMNLYDAMIGFAEKTFTKEDFAKLLKTLQT